jgi:hypothetical protein
MNLLQALDDPYIYNRLAGNLRRIFETIGIERIMRAKEPVEADVADWSEVKP